MSPTFPFVCKAKATSAHLSAEDSRRYSLFITVGEVGSAFSAAG
jgi:hypothetical protein